MTGETRKCYMIQSMEHGNILLVNRWLYDLIAAHLL